ncbi:MAG: DUF86 domain-containing protein [Acidobacteria bacterium]|nr:DUF86 domain-containing protein [Acidobacteriota bacterium]
MVDLVVLARKVAAIRDAVGRIREVLPATSDAFLADRTAREVVSLNLFIALQETIGLATHWLADEGAMVPDTYGDVFSALAERGIIDAALGERLRAAVGLRNLVAHQYGVLDFVRVHEVARVDVADLLAFCEQLSARVRT